MRRAVAVLKGDSPVTGVVRFEQLLASSPTSITAVFKNLPAGDHGFHVHEYGDATNGCISAGDHFNPCHHDHGGPQSEFRHVGDLGNVTSTGEEETKFEIEDTLVSLYGLLSVVGRSIVIHELEDDEGLGGWPDSKINGHSGARLACGVIGWTTNE